MRGLRQLICLMSIFTFLSCSQEKVTTKDHRFDVKYTFKIGDSTLLNKFQEYYLDIKISDSLVYTKKTLFNVVRKKMSDKVTMHVLDSIQVNYILNPQFEIEKIVNFEALKEKINKILNIFYPNYQKDRKVKNFIQNVCLDSTYIVDKNTNSIQIFNNALHYLKKPNDFANLKIALKTTKEYKEISYGYVIQNDYLKQYFDIFTKDFDFGVEIPTSKNAFVEVHVKFSEKLDEVYYAEEITTIEFQNSKPFKSSIIMQGLVIK